MRKSGIRITHIQKNSRLAKEGVKSGWRILRINNHPIEDLLDFTFYSSALRLSFELTDLDGDRRKICFYRKHWNEEIGIEVEQMRIKRCANRCIFCFVDQLPKNLRRGLHVRDEDYRFSFLHGTYITGTNLAQTDLERIARLRLSPLYFSVHATNPEVRQRILGLSKPVTDILTIFKFLKRHDLRFHTQIVLCPGINDGAILDKTISDLMAFTPSLESIAIVPVGITEHRKGLTHLEAIDRPYALDLIRRMRKTQKILKNQSSNGIVFLSDEVYLLAGKNPPMYRGEKHVPQLENGVGMAKEFYAEWRKALGKIPQRLRRSHRAGIISGMLGERVLRRIVDKLNEVENLQVDVLPVENTLFGKTVTVSGLLSGADILARLESEKNNYDLFLIPRNALRWDDMVFLDDITLSQIQKRINKPIEAIENSVVDTVETILPKLEVRS